MDIKKYRKQKKMTQTKLAEKIGVTRNAIARYEKGDMTPKTDKLILLSEALDHDFVADAAKESLEKHRSSERREHTHMKPIDLEGIMRENMLFPHSRFFESCFMYMGFEASYETTDYVRNWTFKDKDGLVSKPIDERAIESLFDRFIEHMKIDFQAFLEEQENNGREEEQAEPSND